MKQRIKIHTTDPAAFKVMNAFAQYQDTTELTPIHKDLIKIRASQINGYAYCIDMHTRDARKNGETEQRIYALNAWRETPFLLKKKGPYLRLLKK